jgi:CIC family chloride channel protein
VGAPLTGVVLILEMTGNYEQLFPLLVACMTAFLMAERLRVEPIYDALLQYDLQRTGVHAGQQAEHVMMDVTVEPHSPMDGRRVRNLGLPQGCLLVLIRRGGREIVPGGETRLRPGDQLQVVVAGDISHACALIREAARAVS